MSSEFVSWKRRASAAIFRAYASPPIRVAWNRPLPATTKLADRARLLLQLHRPLRRHRNRRLVDFAEPGGGIWRDRTSPTPTRPAPCQGPIHATAADGDEDERPVGEEVSPGEAAMEHGLGRVVRIVVAGGDAPGGQPVDDSPLGVVAAGRAAEELVAIASQLEPVDLVAIGHLDAVGRAVVAGVGGDAAREDLAGDGLPP
jgi:hypothetical protein